MITVWFEFNVAAMEGIYTKRQVIIPVTKKLYPWFSGDTPASNLGYLAPPPGQFFIGAKLFIGTPWMGNEGVLKKILVWAM